MIIGLVFTEVRIYSLFNCIIVNIKNDCKGMQIPNSIIMILDSFKPLSNTPRYQYICQKTEKVIFYQKHREMLISKVNLA